MAHDMVHHEEPILLREAARRLRMSVKTARRHLGKKNWRAIPPPIKLAGKLAWLPSQIDRHLAALVAQAEQAAGLTLPTPPPIRRGTGRPRKSA